MEIMFFQSNNKFYIFLVRRVSFYYILENLFTVCLIEDS